MEGIELAVNPSAATMEGLSDRTGSALEFVDASAGNTLPLSPPPRPPLIPSSLSPPPPNLSSLISAETAEVSSAFELAGP